MSALTRTVVQGTGGTSAWKVDGSAVTQPVSDAGGSLTVDDGAGSLTVDSAQLPAALGAGGGIKVDGSGTALPISAASLPLPTGAATSALQGGGLPAALGAGGGLKIDGSGTALPVSAASLPLPSGAATEATLSALSAKLPSSLGPKAASAALAVISADLRAPFGEPISVQVQPIAQQHFTYGINPKMTATLTKSGSSVTASGASGNGSDLVVSIDTTANAFAIARSFRALHYRPGVGQIRAFTAAFNTGVASSRQFAGLWSPNAEYTIGYNGTTWGLFAKTAGAQAIYSLTVTNSATSNGNVTVTLDGTAVTVAVTNVGAGAQEKTAQEIAAGSYGTAGAAGTWGWDAYALGTVVYFVARRARATAGSFSFAGGGTGATATGPTAVRAGVAETLDFGDPSAAGNFTFLYKLDGSDGGPNIDKQKGAVYVIAAGHLGHRGADYFVVDPTTRQLIWFARYNYHNTSTANAMQNPTMYGAWGIEANGSTTAMTMYGGSSMEGLAGQLAPDEGIPWAVTSDKGAQNATEVHYLTIRNGPVFGAGGQTVRASRAEIHVDDIGCSTFGGNSGSYCDFFVYRNATLPNTANFAQVNSTEIALWAWRDTTSTGAFTPSGTLLDTIRVGTGLASGSNLRWTLAPGETITVTAKASSNTQSVRVDIRGWEVS